jgi:hypothetical protein
MIVLAVALLGGCFDIEMQIELADDGSSELSGTYRIGRDAWNTGVFDDDDPNRMIPVSRRDLEELALSHAGVVLDRYRIDEERSGVTIEYRFRVENPDALASLWTGFSESARGAVFDPSARTIALPVTEETAALDPDEIDLVRSGLRGARYRLVILAPSDITSIVSGTDEMRPVSDGRSVTIDVELAEIVTRPNAYTLEIEWE